MHIKNYWHIFLKDLVLWFLTLFASLLIYKEFSTCVATITVIVITYLETIFKDVFLDSFARSIRHSFWLNKTALTVPVSYWYWFVDSLVDMMIFVCAGLLTHYA